MDQPAYTITRSFRSIYVCYTLMMLASMILLLDIFMKMAKLLHPIESVAPMLSMNINSDFRNFLIKADNNKKKPVKRKEKIETTTLICILVQSL